MTRGATNASARPAKPEPGKWPTLPATCTLTFVLELTAGPSSRLAPRLRGERVASTSIKGEMAIPPDVARADDGDLADETRAASAGLEATAARRVASAPPAHARRDATAAKSDGMSVSWPLSLFQRAAAMLTSAPPARSSVVQP